MKVFSIQTIKSLVAFWVASCIWALTLFFNNDDFILKFDNLDLSVGISFMVSVNMLSILLLFHFGDYGIFSISKYLREAKKGDTTWNYLCDLSSIVVQSGILVCISYLYNGDILLFQTLLLVLTMVNVTWLSFKRRTFNSMLSDIDITNIDKSSQSGNEKKHIFSLKEKIQLCIISTEVWTVLNVLFMGCSLLLISITPRFISEEYFDLIWLGVLMLRSIFDFVLCRKYYVKVLEGHYNYDSL